MRCTERRLTPAALASSRPVQWGSRPAAAPRPNRLSAEGCWAAAGGLARLARLVAQQPFDALRHEPRLPGPHHRLRFTRPAHDLGSAAAVGGGKDNIGAPHALLCL